MARATYQVAPTEYAPMDLKNLPWKKILIQGSMIAVLAAGLILFTTSDFGCMLVQEFLGFFLGD